MRHLLILLALAIAAAGCSRGGDAASGETETPEVDTEREASEVDTEREAAEVDTEREAAEALAATIADELAVVWAHAWAMRPDSGEEAPLALDDLIMPDEDERRALFGDLMDVENVFQAKVRIEPAAEDEFGSFAFMRDANSRSGSNRDWDTTLGDLEVELTIEGLTNLDTEERVRALRVAIEDEDEAGNVVQVEAVLLFPEEEGDGATDDASE